MKIRFKFLVLVIICLFTTSGSFAQVGIGTETPNSSAILDLQSSNKGLLPPRMTIYQRDAIVAPADGLIIFNTTSGCPNYYFSGSWHEYCGTVSPPFTPFTCGTSTVTFNYNGSSVTYGTVVSVGNKCWLDRNLGATQVATSSTDVASYGHLFQWGRLDDGHQVRNSPTTTELSTSDVPGHENFIKVTSNPYDWRSTQNNNLWQGEGGTNNPCPDGFRLPIAAEWDTERTSWNPYNAEGAFNSPLKMPRAGYRYYLDGTVGNEGSDGYYWLANASGAISLLLNINSYEATMGYENRANGFSVRCIKD